MLLQRTHCFTFERNHSIVSDRRIPPGQLRHGRDLFQSLSDHSRLLPRHSLAFGGVFRFVASVDSPCPTTILQRLSTVNKRGNEQVILEDFHIIRYGTNKRDSLCWQANLCRDSLLSSLQH
jgi:hypothetical protein